jgi:hypothetical protein
LDLNLKKKLVKRYAWSTVLYGGDTWTLRKVDRKYPDSFELWSWRRTEISWTERVRNGEVFRTVRRKGTSYISKTKEGCLDWSHLAYELLSKSRYGRKNRRMDRSDGRKRM